MTTKAVDGNWTNPLAASEVMLSSLQKNDIFLPVRSCDCDNI